MSLNAFFKRVKRHISRARVWKKYAKIAEKERSKIDADAENAPHEKSNKIFVCWFQGFDNAPEVVKICYASLIKHHPDKEIIVITEDNYKQYVDIPQFIIDKYNKGVFTKTHFSDILRLELLIKYGGCWVDSTAYFTAPIPEYVFKSDLFLFQAFKEHVGTTTAISSWLIHSCSNNKMLLMERELLYRYWAENKKIADYFMFHSLFVRCVIPAFPQEWRAVPLNDNSSPKILDYYLFQPYNAELFEAIASKNFVHKLMYKYPQEKFDMKGTYYDELRQEYLATLNNG